MRKINYIVVHCSATREGRTLTPEALEAEHRRRGFRCIGYHYVVRLDGSIEQGRDENTVGAHCTGHNAASIGVVYVGGLDSHGLPDDTRTPAQRQALRTLLARLRSRHPDATIRSHRDFAAKACPCFDATREYADL